MINNFFKQVGKSARDTAKDMAKKIVREPVEILRETGSQMVGSPDVHNKPEMSMMQQVMTGDGKVGDISPQMEQSIHAQAKNRLQQIEAELRQLRNQREQRSQDWAKEQNELMKVGSDQQVEKQKQFVAAPGKPKHGPKGPGQQKKSMETGKQNKG